MIWIELYIISALRQVGRGSNEPDSALWCNTRPHAYTFAIGEGSSGGLKLLRQVGHM